MSNFSEQELVRREKLKKIIELGINPYPAETFQVSHLAVKIIENFKTLKDYFLLFLNILLNSGLNHHLTPMTMTTQLMTLFDY